jgi:hypothetical protein
VAPIPVISVDSGARSVELTIGPALCHQVAPASAIFAVIPTTAEMLDQHDQLRQKRVQKTAQADVIDIADR